MSFRRGVNRFLIVVIAIWELLLLFFLTTTNGQGGPSLFIGMMLGVPILATIMVRAMFWIIEGFKGSPLE